MTAHADVSTRRPLFAAVGAVYCAAAVALGAYAAHGADAASRPRLDSAMLYLFLHGVALIALQARMRGRVDAVLAAAIATGCALFSGSLIGGALFGWPTTLAPIGGSTLIIAWLGVAAWSAFNRA